jgi:uncharacterized membrane protein
MREDMRSSAQKGVKWATWVTVGFAAAGGVFNLFAHGHWLMTALDWRILTILFIVFLFGFTANFAEEKQAQRFDLVLERLDALKEQIDGLKDR